MTHCHMCWPVGAVHPCSSLAKKPISHAVLLCWHHLEQEPTHTMWHAMAPLLRKHADSSPLRAQPVFNVVLAPLDAIECEEALGQASSKLCGCGCHLACLLVCQL